jgi:hypothetical protein
MVKKETTPTGDGKEKEPSRRSKRSGDKQEEKRDVGTLQKFLLELKLFTWMKTKDPSSADFTELSKLEKDLSSSDKNIRIEARKKIDVLSAVFDQAKGKAGLPLDQLVDEAGLLSVSNGPEIKSLALNIQSKNDKLNEKITKSEAVTEAELNEFELNLNTMKEMMGFRSESRVGLRRMEDTLVSAIELNKVRRDVESPGVYIRPMESKEGFFKEGGPRDKNDKRLHVEIPEVIGTEKLEDKVERVKKWVVEEQIENSGEKMDELEGADLIKRLEDISDLKARAKNLVGKNSEKFTETMEALSAAESGYRIGLEELIANELNFRENSPEDMALGEAMTELVERAGGGRYGKSKYRLEFEGGYDELMKSIKKRVNELKTSPRFGGFERILEDAPANPQAWMDRMQRGGKFAEDMDDIGAGLDYVLKKAGTEFNANLLQNLKDENTGRAFGEQLIENAKNGGASGSEQASLREYVERIWGDKTGMEKEQARFEELLNRGQHGKAYRLLKTYIAKVGLRETSSDFEFAIMLRKAKYRIQSVNQDIGEEFDQWQQSNFVPGLVHITPENSIEIMPKVWDASNVDHVLGADYANGAAMSIEIKGERKTWSPAAMYQELQSTRSSMIILDAKVNSTDSACHRIFLEHMFGEGAHRGGNDNELILDVNGREIGKTSDKFWVTDFQLATADLAAGKLQDETREAVSLGDIIEQSTWMNRRAMTFWMYSGEVSEHLAHYPKEQMQNASKWAAAADRMGHGYNSHFGKITGPYEQLAKVGHMLPDLRVYKDTATMTSVIRENLIQGALEASEGGKVDKKKMRAFAEVLTKKLEKQIEVEGIKLAPVGMRSREEVRLLGNTHKSPEEAWDKAIPWLEAHGMPREIIPDSARISKLLSREVGGEKLSGEDEDWAVQAKEFFQLCKDLQWGTEETIDVGGVMMSELGLMNRMTSAELSPLAKRKNHIQGTNWQPQNITEFMRDFDFSAVMNPAHFYQGTDPLEYASKYKKLAIEVAGKQPKLFSGLSMAKDLIEVEKAMRSYLPPEVVDAWTEAFTRIDMRANRWQSPLNAYEVAQTAKDRRTILNRKITNEDGKTYWFVGRDGHRIAKKEMFWGAYSEKYWGRKPLKDKDVQIKFDALMSEGMLPKDVSDDLLNDILGGGKTLDKLLGLEGKGLSEKQVARRKFTKKVLAKAWRYIRMIPLFDDPGWVAWSFGSELVNFIFKDFGKAAIEGVAK